MLAYANGHEIQYKFEDEDVWVDTDNPIFDWTNIDYRIKKEPTYRPFKDKEECWAEMQKHQPLGWVKNTESFTCLTSIGDTTDFNYVYQTLCFADGSPFGITEVEE